MSILAALAVLASCERKPEFSEVTELGCARNEAVVDAAGGGAIFSIIASGEVCAEVHEGAEWASLSESSWTGDADLCIAFGENIGRERKADVLLTSGHRKLQLTLIQSGAEDATFHFKEKNVTVPFESGAQTAIFETIIPADEISGNVIYPDGGDWIEEPLAGVNADGTFNFAVR